MAGEPTVERFRMILEKRGLTHEQAAAILGVTDRTIRRWLSDPSLDSHVECPEWAVKLLDLATKPRRKP